MRLLLITCCAAAALAVEGDVVILDNGRTLPGRVEDVPGRPQVVLVRSASMTLTLPRSRVRGNELGLESRLALLDRDTCADVVALARWCRTNGHLREALELMDLARRLPAFDRDAATFYIRLVDEQQGPEAALPFLLWYSKSGGGSKDLADRLQQLLGANASLAARAPLDPRLAPDLPSVAPVVAQVTTVIAKEGLEVRGWRAESVQYSNPIEAKVVPTGDKDLITGVKRVLEVSFKGGDRSKAVVRKPVSYSVQPTASSLTFRVANPGKEAISIALGLKTGDYVYHESEAKEVAPGQVTTLRFDLRANSYKSKATEWANNGGIDHLDDVRELQVLIYNYRSDGRVQISGIDFEEQRSEL